MNNVTTLSPYQAPMSNLAARVMHYYSSAQYWRLLEEMRSGGFIKGECLQYSEKQLQRAKEDLDTLWALYVR